MLLPLRRVWSECLLVVLHRDSRETVKERNKNHQKRFMIRAESPQHNEKSDRIIYTNII